MFEGLTDEQKQAIVADLSDMDAKLPGGGLAGYLQRARGRSCEISLLTLDICSN